MRQATPNLLRVAFSKRIILQLKKKNNLSNRSKTGVNFSQLAKEIGKSTHLTRNYVLGISFPTLETLIKMANFLEVPPGWLLFGSNPVIPKRLRQEEYIIMDRCTLQPILKKTVPLLKSSAYSLKKRIKFVIDMIHDISRLNVDEKTRLKIINLAFSKIEFKKSIKK